MNNTVAITRLNEKELAAGTAGTAGSWHAQYAHSAVVYAGNLEPEVTEGDLLAVFEQYGRVVHLNLARERRSGRSRGFAFLAYADQRSTVLAVDNLNAVQLGARTLRVDHVDKYKVPDDAQLLDLAAGDGRPPLEEGVEQHGGETREQKQDEGGDEGEGGDEDEDEDEDERAREGPVEGDEIRYKRIMKYLERRRLGAVGDDASDRVSGRAAEVSETGLGKLSPREKHKRGADLSSEERRKRKLEKKFRKEERARIRREREIRRRERARRRSHQS